MAGDAQATRRRLLDAAAEEFSAYGIAGARVDRIAAAARSNKAQIYHYFGGKDELFDAVFNDLIVATVRAVPIDPADLPGYAGRLFDGHEKHPQVARLATWYRLERAGTNPPLEALVRSSHDKIAAISRAQKAGDLPKHFAAADLLALVLTLSAMWTAMGPEFAGSANTQSAKHRRRVVTEAVTALLER